MGAKAVSRISGERDLAAFMIYLKVKILYVKTINAEYLKVKILHAEIL